MDLDGSVYFDKCQTEALSQPKDLLQQFECPIGKFPFILWLNTDDIRTSRGFDISGSCNMYDNTWYTFALLHNFFLIFQFRFDSLEQDCSITITNAMEILQSCS